jgi:fatty-acyl-CoA synthase
MTVGDPLAWRAATTPDATALVDLASGARLTYRALNERADRLAHALRARGVGPGDGVALLAPDGVRHFDLLFACGKLGAASVPLNGRLHAREIEGQLRLVEPALAVVADGETADHLRACDGLPPLLSVEEMDALREAAPAEPVAGSAVTERTTACLLFTGGTTGAPKAAQISHGQIAWNAFSAHLADVQGTDTVLNVFPLFHTGGLFAFAVPLLILGGTVVQAAGFDADDVLRRIEAERVTIFGGVPTVFQRLAAADGWDAADLSSLRYALSGGAPLPVGLIRRYRDEKGVVFRQGFGMTEFGPAAFSLAAADAERKAGSIGRPNAFVDARVVDPETDRPVPTGAVGELVLRGPAATTGYFRDPEATAAAFDADGFFHTGDLARVDDEGYVSIVGRRKEMYISGGENVYPAEVEAALDALPAVAQCAVVGLPDERWGEAGLAFVVLAPGADATEAELLDALRARLARYKVPRAVVFRDALPLSGAGKVLKRQLLAEVAHA